MAMRKRSGFNRDKGKLRTRVPNLGLIDPPELSAKTATDHEARTGRFAKGNRAAKRRTMKASAPIIVGLDPDNCEPWLRPFAKLAGEHAAALVGEMRIESNTLSGLAIDTAAAMAIYRGLLSLGAQGDRKALAEARAWLRETRQNIITLTSLVGDEAKPAPKASAHAALAEALDDDEVPS
jgi:hypothetical protein